MRRRAGSFPLPACGERAGVRGGGNHRFLWPPLTPTLSPFRSAHGEREQSDEVIE
jgi:hypothetical protein